MPFVNLPTRPTTYEIPSYSLTGDLLAFRHCGLRYRFHGIGKMPETRPVQRWYGVFIHGCLDEAYRYYKAFASGRNERPPWHPVVLTEIIELVTRRLENQDLRAWSHAIRVAAEARVTTTLREAGPRLLPMILQTETRVTGTRPLAEDSPTRTFRVVDRYEVTGVIDAVASLSPGSRGLVEEAMRSTLGLLPDAGTTVIIDYKGSRRPSLAHTPGTLARDGVGNDDVGDTIDDVGLAEGQPTVWTSPEWQVASYADLWSAGRPIHQGMTGMVIYINELHPNEVDFLKFQTEIRLGLTDVPPEGRLLAEALAWRRGNPLPALPLRFRLLRAMRSIPVNAEAIRTAATAFDSVVTEIEECLSREHRGGTMREVWQQNPNPSCPTCDLRFTCSAFQATSVGRRQFATPRAPEHRGREGQGTLRHGGAPGDPAPDGTDARPR